MQTKAPPTRRRFATDWEQIEYLYRKVLYWFCDRADRRRASRFAERLRRLVETADPKREAILGLSSRAILAELRGELSEAIRFREREIESIHRLLRTNAPPDALPGPDELSDRLDLLAILYWQVGDVAKAIRTLEESKRYCQRLGIAFDGQELLDDFSRVQESKTPGPLAS